VARHAPDARFSMYELQTPGGLMAALALLR
jgi:hypothetical protein